MKYYDKLIFELSKDGRCGYSLPAAQFKGGTDQIAPSLKREKPALLPR